jgi:hypothetical protein
MDQNEIPSDFHIHQFFLSDFGDKTIRQRDELPERFPHYALMIRISCKGLLKDLSIKSNPLCSLKWPSYGQQAFCLA